MVSKGIDIIEGIVQNIYDSEQNDKGLWRPAKMVIATATNLAEIAFWPKSNYETKEQYFPLQFDDTWNYVKANLSEGDSVQVIAEYTNTYNDKDQYKNAKKVVKLGGSENVPTAKPVVDVVKSTLSEGTDKDRLIVDQVLTKIAADIYLSRDDESPEACASEAIRLWTAIRNRHVEEEPLGIVEALGLEEELGEDGVITV